MNKYEKALLNIVISPHQNEIDILKELVERTKNGIYISNEKTTELLEDYEELGKLHIKAEWYLKHNLGYKKLKDKLKQALGGS